MLHRFFSGITQQIWQKRLRSQILLNVVVVDDDILRFEYSTPKLFGSWQWHIINYDEVKTIR